MQSGARNGDVDPLTGSTSAQNGSSWCSAHTAVSRAGGTSANQPQRGQAITSSRVRAPAASAPLAPGGIQSDRRANEGHQRLLVDLLAFPNVDRAPGVAFQARVEEAVRVLERRALGEGHLHEALVGLARADDSVM